MSYLYVNEQGAAIGVSGERVEVKYKSGLLKSIPLETLEVEEEEYYGYQIAKNNECSCFQAPVARK